MAGLSVNAFTLTTMQNPKAFNRICDRCHCSLTARTPQLPSIGMGCGGLSACVALKNANNLGRGRFVVYHARPH
jgi:hypothetical protein